MGTLGSGNSGTVRLAYDTDLERYVAIKEFSPTLVGDPYFLERLRADSPQLKRLDSPNCVAVYDFIEAPGRAWLVSEYVEGASLRRILDRSGFLSQEQALGVVKGAVNGLGYAHSLGLVHRDVKPANVLVNREGLAKLTDFGQALFTPGPGASGGIPAGTPAYMSPEQVTGGTVDYRSDIYSCGAMLYECLTGKTPYYADSALAMMRMHVSEPVPDPRKLNNDIPQGVAEMVMRAMAKDPADRQPSAFQFLADLEQAAVAGYGENWQSRASVRTLVAAILAAGGTPLLDRTPPPPGGRGGPIPAAGNEWWRDWRLLVGGAAVALLLIFGIAFALGRGGQSTSGGVAVAGPSPTPSAATSPSPAVSPSPTPSPSPSPTPSPSPSPRLSPSPSSSPTPGPITISNASIYYKVCSSTPPPGQPQCPTSPPSPGGSTPLAVSCATGSWVHFYEQYSWTYPGSGGNPVTFKIQWQGVYPGGSLDSSVSSSGATAVPGTGMQSAASASGYDDTPIKSKPPGTGYVYFNLTWTQPDGHSAGTFSSPTFSYTC